MIKKKGAASQSFKSQEWLLEFCLQTFSHRLQARTRLGSHFTGAFQCSMNPFLRSRRSTEASTKHTRGGAVRGRATCLHAVARHRREDGRGSQPTIERLSRGPQWPPPSHILSPPILRPQLNYFQARRVTRFRSPVNADQDDLMGHFFWTITLRRT